MPRRQKQPLRPLTPIEQAHLERVSRAQSEPAAHVAHAKALLAVAAGHGGGQPQRYAASEQERILREVRRPPDREVDGTATWSLSTLQRALRRAPDGLPGVSTYTISCVLHDAGYTWQRDRSWCETGTAVRKRNAGTVTVHDPDAAAKKT